MAAVMTVLGPIAPEEVGVTAMHEHIIFGMPGWEWDEEALRMEVLGSPAKVFERINNDLLDFRLSGGKTFVDTSGIGLGREVDLYVNLSRASGVHLIACTGFWAERGIVPYFRNKDIDYLADVFVRELTQGMEGTNVKAGIIKIGTGSTMTPLEERTFRAAARAAKRTGCAVTTHGIQTALQQVEVLLDEGLDPSRIIIGHCDDGSAINLERDKEICRRGAYVGYDHIGTEPVWSPMPYATTDERRVELVKTMIEAGFVNHLVISVDTNGQSTHRPTQLHPYSHLLRYFVPKLRKAGISEEHIQTMLVETPKRVLPF